MSCEKSGVASTRASGAYLKQPHANIAGNEIMVEFLAKDCDPAGLVKSPKPPKTPKYEKIPKKKNTKPPTLGGAQNTKKIPKNTKMVIFGPLLYFFGIFFVFLGPTLGGGFCIFL